MFTYGKTVLLWCFFVSASTFATGHTSAFNSLRFDAAFVGFDSFVNKCVSLET